MSIALAIGITTFGATANAAAPSAPATAATVASTAVAAQLPSAAKNITTKKTTATMHLRAKASKSSKSMKIVPRSTKLVIKAVTGKWHKVTYKGKTGWVSGKYLKTVSVKKVVKKNQSGTGSQQSGARWTETNVNLRSGPSTKNKSLGVINQGTKIQSLQTKGDWSKVKTSKGTGWIKSSYLSKNEVRANRIDARIVKINKLVKAKYGSWVYGYGGYRPGSAGHSSGRASDLMIKNYKTPTGNQRGDKVASYLIKNHRSLGISYLIWEDKIWFANSGWEDYSEGDRWGQQFTGNWNDTTKHLDHIHVEVWKR